MPKPREFKHLLARVEGDFYREVKIRLAQRGLTMHEAIVRGVRHVLDIDDESNQATASK